MLRPTPIIIVNIFNHIMYHMNIFLTTNNIIILLENHDLKYVFNFLYYYGSAEGHEYPDL